MTTRLAALANLAAMELSSERAYDGPMSAADRRGLTQICLRDHAADLGFADDEIAGAVENAIKAANTETAT